jgi:hypothetical protein
MASISCCFCSTSKKPPEMAGALLDVLDVGKGFGCDHGSESESEGEREYAGRQRVPEGEMAAKNRRGRKAEVRAASVGDSVPERQGGSSTL